MNDLDDAAALPPIPGSTAHHAIEAYVSKRAPLYRRHGVERDGLIAKHIRTACAEPGNRAAREAMMLGATTAGMAFSNASVALVHGMSRPIGAFFHVPHGLSNAMLLPEITAFSAPAALDRYADCARAMGVAEEGEGSQAAVARLLDALRALNDDLKVPSPKDYGIAKDRYDELLPTMASQALASGSEVNNPRVPTQDDHRAIPAGVRVTTVTARRAKSAAAISGWRAPGGPDCFAALAMTLDGSYRPELGPTRGDLIPLRRKPGPMGSRSRRR